MFEITIIVPGKLNMDKAPVTKTSAQTHDKTTTLTSPEIPSEAQSEPDNLQDDLGYDEPRCSWSPTEDANQDCGEGLNCPPCD